MANTILTPTMVTREALRILHQKLRFIKSINRQYDDSYAKTGAKIGNTLNIRLPNQYVVRSGATLAAQDTTESSVALVIGTGAGANSGDQRGVDLNFTSADLTTSLDDFSKRILNPAMAVLAASIENHALSNMRKDVYQQVDDTAAAISFLDVMKGRKKMVDSLTPEGDRTALLRTNDNVTLIDALKGLFNNQSTLSKQYTDGVMGNTGGFDFMESTHLSTQLRGAGNGAYTVNGAAQLGASIIVAAGAGAINRGEILTFVGCNMVHPETKLDSGLLQQFVVTADYAGGAGTIAISPSIVVTGATQNVSASPTNGGAVSISGTISVNYGQSMLYHKDAFTFATADLVMPKGLDFAAREVFDGISMRIVRQYDINNDKFPCRLDVFYGFKTIRPQLACRTANLA